MNDNKFTSLSDDSVNGRFADKMRKLRGEKGLTLRDLSFQLRRLGIKMSPGYLCDIENKKVDPPREEKVKALAQVLGGNIEELLALAVKVTDDVSNVIKANAEEIFEQILRLDKMLGNQEDSLSIMTVLALFTQRSLEIGEAISGRDAWEYIYEVYEEFMKHGGKELTPELVAKKKVGMEAIKKLINNDEEN